MLAAGCALSSALVMTSIGDAESVTVRSVRRVPVIMTSSIGAAVAPGAPAGCCWATAILVAAASVDAARILGKNFIRVLPGRRWTSEGAAGTAGSAEIRFPRALSDVVRYSY